MFLSHIKYKLSAVELPLHIYSRIIYNMWRSGVGGRERAKLGLLLYSINNREKEKRSQLLQMSILYVYSLYAGYPALG